MMIMKTFSDINSVTWFLTYSTPGEDEPQINKVIMIKFSFELYLVNRFTLVLAIPFNRNDAPNGTRIISDKLRIIHPTSMPTIVPINRNMVSGIVIIASKLVTVLITRAMATSALKTLDQKPVAIADGLQKAKTVPLYALDEKNTLAKTDSNGVKTNTMNRQNAMTRYFLKQSPISLASTVNETKNIRSISKYGKNGFHINPTFGNMKPRRIPASMINIVEYSLMITLMS
jgi:hypothetical protein